MQVIMQVLTERGWADLARFYSMEACGLVLRALAEVAGLVGVCVPGVAG